MTWGAPWTAGAGFGATFAQSNPPFSKAEAKAGPAAPDAHVWEGPAAFLDEETLHLWHAVMLGYCHDAREYQMQQLEFQADWAALWLHCQRRNAREAYQPMIAVEPGDRRFGASEWTEYPWFAWLKESYLLRSRYWRKLLETADLAPRRRKRLDFFLRQYLDAMAPTNFLAGNPEAAKLAITTQGDSLLQGWRQFLADLPTHKITMSDPKAFKVGENLAITPGAVVFRNELIELIQYAPLTAEVYERPLLIVPPCINKYYILDLQPENSFVRYAVEQGHTVFLISWRNVPPELGHLGFDHYVQDGVFAALDAVTDISGQEQPNTLGFCVGGAILAAALAIAEARGRPRAASCTLLTTMLDYRDVGEIENYVTEQSVTARAPAMEAGGRVHGHELAGAFASLRANELVWSFVVNNYLKGKTPPAFDLLHWNGDSANLPGPMWLWYVRELYLGNRMVQPDALQVCGTALNLQRIKCPAYVLATKEDHIVPWRSAYSTTGLLGGETTFVLGASGHIAGVVNPASKNKRSYWLNPANPADADAWEAAAEMQPGSWWTHWSAWLGGYGGQRVAAPTQPGSRSFPALCAAPGTYVREAA